METKDLKKCCAIRIKAIFEHLDAFKDIGLSYISTTCPECNTSISMVKPTKDKINKILDKYKL